VNWGRGQLLIALPAASMKPIENEGCNRFDGEIFIALGVMTANVHAKQTFGDSVGDEAEWPWRIRLTRDTRDYIGQWADLGTT